MKDNHIPIGSGHASAMFRQGLAELRGALYPDSNVAQPTLYGIVGTRTPGEVAESRRAAELDQEPHTKDPELEAAKDRDDRDLERD
ncbi:MAG: hypothetical protein ACREJD_08450 [Phycisphaerales bacterium]